MKSQLRRLELRLVHERAEEEIARQIYELIVEWDVASYNNEPLPEPIDFVNGLMDAGFYFSTNIKAIDYLTKCKSEGTSPESKRLFQILMPWHR